MPFQSFNLPFGTPLSLPQHYNILTDFVPGITFAWDYECNHIHTKRTAGMTERPFGNLGQIAQELESFGQCNNPGRGSLWNPGAHRTIAFGFIDDLSFSAHDRDKTSRSWASWLWGVRTAVKRIGSCVLPYSDCRRCSYLKSVKPMSG
jgi:hypothetical protein